MGKGFARVENVWCCRHIETKQFVCTQVSGEEYLMCFTKVADAILMRERLRLVEFVDIESHPLKDVPFSGICLDNKMYRTAETIK